MTSAITATGLRKSFSGKAVLDRIDLEVGARTTFSLLSPNGAADMVGWSPFLGPKRSASATILAPDLAKPASAARWPLNRPRQPRGTLRRSGHARRPGATRCRCARTRRPTPSRRQRAAQVLG